MTLFGYRVPMMASLLVWCVAWEIVGRIDLIFLLPPFSEVLTAAVGLVQTPSWQNATVTTLRAFAIGMVLSIVLGVPLGILMGRVKMADDLLGMWVNIFSSAPLSALVPVLMILFGFGEKTIVAAVFLFAIWIIVLDTRAGVRHISPSLIEMARSYGASRRALYRQDHSLCGASGNPRWHPPRPYPRRKGVVIGQLLVAIVGYGALFETFSRNFRMAEFWALTIILFAFALLIAELIERAEAESRILCRSKTMNMHDAAPNYVIEPTIIPAIPVAGSDQLFPVHRVYCVGRNYAAHAVEMGHDPNKEPPFFFQKNPDNLDTSGQFPYPPASNDVHYEIEMVVALKSGGKDIPVEKALDCVYGYGVGLDMTRRDLQGKAKDHGPALGSWKGFRGVGAMYTAGSRWHDRPSHPRRRSGWTSTVNEDKLAISTR